MNKTALREHPSPNVFLPPFIRLSKSAGLFSVSKPADASCCWGWWCWERGRWWCIWTPRGSHMRRRRHGVAGRKRKRFTSRAWEHLILLKETTNNSRVHWVCFLECYWVHVHIVFRCLIDSRCWPDLFNVVGNFPTSTLFTHSCTTTLKKCSVRLQGCWSFIWS